MTEDKIADRVEGAVDNAVARVMIGQGFTSTMVARAAIAAHIAALSEAGFVIAPREPDSDLSFVRDVAGVK